MAQEHRSDVDLYDLFDALIERVPWRTEGEMRQYQELIAKLRGINLFGYMATQIAVDKQFDASQQGANRALPPWTPRSKT